MSATKGEIFVEPRLLILRAAQNNEIEKVQGLLRKDSTLVHAKTTTTSSSLLHVAAERGHEALCHLLFEHGHETNPVDKAGRTPYQCARSVEIQSILVSYHMQFLSDRFYTSEHIPTPEKSFIESIARKIIVVGKAEFAGLPMNGLGSSAFAFTALRPAPERASDKDYGLLTVFREDILMTPFYGELLVIHENEQAIQFIEALASSENGFFGTKGLISEAVINSFEARSYLKSVSAALTLFPFLSEYPQAGDPPAVAEAKKMFVVFGLVGLVDYMGSCTAEHQSSLQTLEYYDTAWSHAAKTLSAANSQKNSALADAVRDKYTSGEAVLAGLAPK